MNIYDGYGALHQMRVKLFTNYLKKIDGKYFAKTENEAFLSIEKTCETMKKRTGYEGSYDTLVNCVRLYLAEVVYQLCNGFGVDLDYFTINPNVGGTFNSLKEPYDRKKNPVYFKYRTKKMLHDLARHIIVELGSLDDGNAFIDNFVDTDEHSENTLFLPDDAFILTGNKIKIAGDDPNVGVFFVPVDDPSKAVKVTRLIENNPSKIIGIAPNTEHQYNRIEIRTQYTNSSNILLKKPRVIASRFVLEAA